ncbi:MAG TPA: FkbM family methyltransferase [bacterium]|nr:FkbM family methyltransferase [bacterium]HPT30053.1 FkbM family methyltransferase [bacterium]
MIIKFQQQTLDFPERDDADQSVIKEIFFWREYRAAEELITQSRSIVDAGAHIGAWSAYAALLSPKAKVYALEPEKGNLSQLKETIKKNKLKTVKIIDQALAGQTGPRKLQIASDSINHTLLPLDSQEPGKTVSAISLADFLSKTKIKEIDFLKMDIEGGEYELLDAWQAADFSKIKNIILEYHKIENRDFKELESRLRENGFSVQIFPSRFDKNLGFILARNKNLK